MPECSSVVMALACAHLEAWDLVSAAVLLSTFIDRMAPVEPQQQQPAAAAAAAGPLPPNAPGATPTPAPTPAPAAGATSAPTAAQPVVCSARHVGQHANLADLYFLYGMTLACLRHHSKAFLLFEVRSVALCVPRALRREFVFFFPRACQPQGCPPAPAPLFVIRPPRSAPPPPPRHQRILARTRTTCAPCTVQAARQHVPCDWSLAVAYELVSLASLGPGYVVKAIHRYYRLRRRVRKDPPPLAIHPTELTLPALAEFPTIMKASPKYAGRLL
jgi:hypothetical protein